MKLTQYQVDAFTTGVFEGNPAAVCPLEEWLDDAVLQAIANENNLSETAFFVPTARGFHLRWFTPVAEVDLCGHATLAAAHVLFERLGYARKNIVFETRSGELAVEIQDGRLVMNFLSRPPTPCPASPALLEGLRQTPTEVWAADDYIAIFEHEAIARSLAPDRAKLQALDRRGVIVTAPGDQVDFVSRFLRRSWVFPKIRSPARRTAH